MPSKSEHLAKAKGNEPFAVALPLKEQANIDWALIAVFYAALHYVEAYLSLNNIHLRSHTSRDGWVGRDSNMRVIFPEYQDLKYYAYNARYEFLNFNGSEVTSKAIPALAKIKAQLQPFL